MKNKKIKKTSWHWSWKIHIALCILAVSWLATGVIVLGYYHSVDNIPWTMKNFRGTLIKQPTVYIAPCLFAGLIFIVELFLWRVKIVELWKNKNLKHDSAWMDPKQFVKISPLTDLKQSHQSGFVVNTVLAKDKTKFQAHGEYHGLIIGSTGSGKTQKIILPTIFYNATSYNLPSMIISDPKGMIADKCQSFLKQQGYQIKTLNFIDFTGTPWNPLQEIIELWKKHDYSNAEIKLNSIANMFLHEVASQNDPIWHLGAENLLVITMIGVLCELEKENKVNQFSLDHILKRLNLSTDELQTWIAEQSEINPILKKITGSILDTDNPNFLQTLKHINNIGLKNFHNENFTTMASSSQIDFKELRSKPTVYFITTHLTDSTYWNLANIFLSSLFNYLIKNNDNCKRQILFVMDEFGNIPHLKNFSKLLATSREYQILFLLSLQSYHQLKKYRHYHDIIANCGIKYYLHTNDIETASAIEKEYGQQMIMTTSYHKTESQQNRNSKTTSYTQQPLISYYELMKLRNQVIIKIQHCDPIKLKMVPFYDLCHLIISPFYVKNDIVILKN